MRIKILGLSFLIGLTVISAVQAKIIWPVSADGVEKIFHVYEENLLQLGLETRGDVYALSAGVVSFVSTIESDKSFVEIINKQNIRIGYIGIISNLRIGQEFEAGDVIGSAPLDSVWYLRIFDSQLETWIDPLQVLPVGYINNTFKTKLVDFEFVYYDRNPDGSIVEAQESEKNATMLERQIQRQMFAGEFRPKITIEVSENTNSKPILQEYLLVKIANREFVFTREDILRYHKNNQTDVVKIKDNRVHFLLPSINLNKGYHNIHIISRGPLNIKKHFRFSILAR